MSLLLREKKFKLSTVSAILVWFLLVLFSTIDVAKFSITNHLLFIKYDYGFAIVLLILLIAYLIIYENYLTRIYFSRIDIILSLYLIFNILLSIFTPNNNNTLYFVEVLLTYTSLRLMLTNNIIGEIYVIICLFVVGLIQAVYGMLQMLHILSIDNRYNLPSGTFNNPAQLAIFLATISGLAYNFTTCRPLAKEKKHQYLQLVSIAIFVLTGMVLVTTQCRSAILSLIFYIIIVTTNRFKKTFTKRLQIVWRRTILLLFFVTGVLIVWIAYNLKKDSADGRILIWKVTTRMIPEIPLWGYGTNNFGNHYMKYQAEYFQAKGVKANDAFLSDEVIYAYNEYLQIIIENGFIGLLLIIVLILLARLNAYLSTGALIIIPMACAMTSYPFRIPCVFLCFIFGVAFTSKSQTPMIKFNFGNRIELAVIAVVASIIFLFTLNSKAYFESKANDAYRFYSVGFYQTASRKYYELDNAQRITNPRMLAYFGKSLAMARKNQEALKVYERASKLSTNYYLVINHGICLEELERYKDAENKYRFATEMLPGRLYPKYLLFQLYKKTNQIKLAKYEARSILNVKDKKLTPASVEMRKNVIDFLASK